MLVMTRSIAALVAGLFAMSTQGVAGGTGAADRVLEFQEIPSPAASASFLPQLIRRDNGDIVASWLELRGTDYVFQLSVRHGDRWSPSRVIAKGSDLSHFSADLPGVAETAEGTLVAYWQLTDRSGSDDYATVIQIATSADGGQTWTKPRRPYVDAAPGQHGFLSTFRTGADLGLVWLDAKSQSERRSTAAKDSSMGAIGLRNVTVNNAGHMKADTWINPIVCECCPTSAIATAEGPVVVFRGRAEKPNAMPTEIHTDAATVRDIQIVRMENGRWGTPHTVHADNWVINACPDNGPAIDASGEDLVVAWWTAPDDRPKVQVAFSGDAGTHFGAPIRVDRASGEGQVTVVWDPVTQSAVVGWLEDHKVWARIVSRDRQVGPPLAVGASPPHARLPRWISSPDGILAAWTGVEGDVRSVRFATLRVRSNSKVAARLGDSPQVYADHR